ncbi:MAG: LacI family DNA-binding transcriptional regulator, partial [Planctomycetota bacterium]
DMGKHPATHTQPGWSFFVASGTNFEAATVHRDVLTVRVDRKTATDEKLWHERASELSRNVSGVVVGPFHDVNVHLERVLSKLKVPTASWHHPVDDDPPLKVDRVLPDHEAGAGLLVDELVTRGCRRIVQIAPRNSSLPWWPMRRVGYEQAMRRHDLQIRPPVEVRPPLHWVPPDARPDDFDEVSRNIAGHLIEQLTGPDRADALLVPGDALVPVVARACRLFGLEPNRDVLLAGYDNLLDGHWALEHEPTRPIVTVDKHNFDIGRGLVRTLTARLAGEFGPIDGEPHTEFVEPKLVFNESKRD